jgi:hypothetical protein
MTSIEQEPVVTEHVRMDHCDCEICVPRSAPPDADVSAHMLALLIIWLRWPIRHALNLWCWLVDGEDD